MPQTCYNQQKQQLDKVQKYKSANDKQAYKYWFTEYVKGGKHHLPQYLRKQKMKTKDISLKSISKISTKHCCFQMVQIIPRA